MFEPQNSIKRITLLGTQTSLPARSTITQSSRVLLNVQEIAVSAPLMPPVKGEIGRFEAAPSASLRNWSVQGFPADDDLSAAVALLHPVRNRVTAIAVRHASVASDFIKCVSLLAQS
jgi:hypothetical protein